ncbi:activator of (R)-2-hydroxyglutaryl-CoA dehydratase [Cutibacterium acnes JCM 18909]|nr:activator of (R)-2-hydroxyglutaryl-CoA dehydratase [Cutibacterium acnes JCM 18909]
MWFVYNCLSAGDYNYQNFGTDKWSRHVKKSFPSLAHAVPEAGHRSIAQVHSV